MEKTLNRQASPMTGVIGLLIALVFAAGVPGSSPPLHLWSGAVGEVRRAKDKLLVVRRGVLLEKVLQELLGDECINFNPPTLAGHRLDYHGFVSSGTEELLNLFVVAAGVSIHEVSGCKQVSPEVSEGAFQPGSIPTILELQPCPEMEVRNQSLLEWSLLATVSSGVTILPLAELTGFRIDLLMTEPLSVAEVLRNLVEQYGWELGGSEQMVVIKKRQPVVITPQPAELPIPVSSEGGMMFRIEEELENDLQINLEMKLKNPGE
jgi:hypothetical protein